MLDVFELQKQLVGVTVLAAAELAAVVGEHGVHAKCGGVGAIAKALRLGGRAKLRILYEFRAPQYPMRFPDAGQPSAFWRPGANAWAYDPAGATARSDGRDAGR